jgi:hypothetical protein
LALPRIITTDPFGNLITNIAHEELGPFAIRWCTPMAMKSSSSTPMAMSDPARCRRGSISFGVRQIALLTRTQPNASGRCGVPTKMAERA